MHEKANISKWRCKISIEKNFGRFPAKHGDCERCLQWKTRWRAVLFPPFDHKWQNRRIKADWSIWHLRIKIHQSGMRQRKEKEKNEGKHLCMICCPYGNMWPVSETYSLNISDKRIQWKNFYDREKFIYEISRHNANVTNYRNFNKIEVTRIFFWSDEIAEYSKKAFLSDLLHFTVRNSTNVEIVQEFL